MDTLLIIRDSVAVVTNKATMNCQPCIKEAATNDKDLIFVGIICATILIISLYVIFRYFKWKDDERNAKNTAKNKKIEQKERKQ